MVESREDLEHAPEEHSLRTATKPSSILLICHPGLPACTAQHALRPSSRRHCLSPRCVQAIEGAVEGEQTATGGLRKRNAQLFEGRPQPEGAQGLVRRQFPHLGDGLKRHLARWGLRRAGVVLQSRPALADPALEDLVHSGSTIIPWDCPRIESQCAVRNLARLVSRPPGRQNEPFRQVSLHLSRPLGVLQWLWKTHRSC
jgi:hypothetical protein